MSKHAEYGHDTSVNLPTFIGVGPPRTGTTWLDKILRGHVNLPARQKETLFFDVRYERGIHWYLRHFKNRRPGVPTGEFGNPTGRRCPLDFTRTVDRTDWKID